MTTFVSGAPYSIGDINAPAGGKAWGIGQQDSLATFNNGTYVEVVFAASDATSQTLRVRKLTLSGSFPAGATITGIQVTINSGPTTGGGIQDSIVQLIKSDTGSTSDRVGANRAANAAIPASAIYGGDSDLWGTTWSLADVQAQGFGVDIVLSNPFGLARTWDIDQVAFYIYYTLPVSHASAAFTSADDSSVFVARAVIKPKLAATLADDAGTLRGAVKQTAAAAIAAADDIVTLIARPRAFGAFAVQLLDDSAAFAAQARATGTFTVQLPDDTLVSASRAFKAIRAGYSVTLIEAGAPRVTIREAGSNTVRV